jgi:hypothetical protein
MATQSNQTNYIPYIIGSVVLLIVVVVVVLLLKKKPKPDSPESPPPTPTPPTPEEESSNSGWGNSYGSGGSSGGFGSGSSTGSGSGTGTYSSNNYNTNNTPTTPSTNFSPTPTPIKTFNLLSSSSLTCWDYNTGCSGDDNGIKVGANNYCYKNLGNALFNTEILFLIKITTSCDFYFGCDSSGKGFMLHLDRIGNSGFAPTTNWTTRTNPNTEYSITENAYQSILIKISDTGVASWSINSGRLKEETITINSNGFIGLVGSVDNTNIKNINISIIKIPIPKSIPKQWFITIGKRIIGNDIGDSFSNSTLAKCQDLCAVEQTCKASVLDLTYSKCYLKTVVAGLDNNTLRTLSALPFYSNAGPGINLTNWVTNCCSIVYPNIGGNPDLAIFVPAGAFCAYNFPTSLLNTTITFSFLTTGVLNFFFGCDSFGSNGLVYKFDTQANSGFSTPTNWSTRGTSGSCIQFPASTWINIVLSVSLTGLVNIYVDEFTKCSVQLPNSGGNISTYFAFLGDTTNVNTASYFKDFYIGYPCDSILQTQGIQYINYNYFINFYNWTLSTDPPIIINGTICVYGNRYCYYNLGSSLYNTTISFNVNTNSYCGFFIGCNSTGQGIVLRLDSTNNLSGFMFVNSWSLTEAGGSSTTSSTSSSMSSASPASQNTDTRFMIPALTRLSVQINIDSSGKVSWFINKIQQPGMISVSSSTENTYIGLIGDVGNSTSQVSYFTNIIVNSTMIKPAYPLSIPVIIPSTWTNNNSYTNGILSVPPGGVSTSTFVNVNNSLFNRQISLTVNLPNVCCNIYFGCKSDDSIKYSLRMDTRLGITNKSGFMTNEIPITGPFLTANTDYAIIINISIAGICTWFLNNVLQNTSLILPTTASTFIGFKSDTQTSNAVFSNIKIN